MSVIADRLAGLGGKKDEVKQVELFCERGRDRLNRFLADPAEMFPGLWMSIRGIEDGADRAALAGFLTDPASR